MMKRAFDLRPCSPRACSRSVAHRTAAFPASGIPALAGYTTILVLLIAGCQSNKPANQKKQKQQTSAQPALQQQPRSNPLNKADGCDARLQDIGGLFLMYSLMNHRLPESL